MKQLLHVDVTFSPLTNETRIFTAVADEHPGLVAEGHSPKQAMRNLVRLLSNLVKRGAIDDFEIAEKPRWIWTGLTNGAVQVVGRSAIAPIVPPGSGVVGEAKFLTA